jgi:AcrR family transcriptional regulator
VRRTGEAKRDATRRTLLERALELFQKDGVEATTMRDIARAAGLSLGAAYYYFPSKEALVFAYYEENQAQVEDVVERATGTLRERLGTIFHAKLESIRPQRAMLASILPHLVNPGDPLSAFSAQTRDVRIRAIAMFERALADPILPPGVVPVLANALWLLQLACMLVYVNDDSPNESRTHGLVDDGLDMLVPMLPLLATPIGAALCDRIVAALGRAGIQITA